MILLSSQSIQKMSGQEIDSYIDYDRDMLFTYAGLRQVVDKYLVQDRSTGEKYETPQQMYIMIAAVLFANYPKEKRLDYVRKILQCNLKTQNQHPNTSHGRRQNTNQAVCVLRSG